MTLKLGRHTDTLAAATRAPVPQRRTRRPCVQIPWRRTPLRLDPLNAGDDSRAWRSRLAIRPRSISAWVGISHVDALLKRSKFRTRLSRRH